MKDAQRNGAFVERRAAEDKDNTGQIPGPFGMRMSNDQRWQRYKVALVLFLFFFVIGYQLVALSIIGYGRFIGRYPVLIGQWGLTQQGITSFTILQTNMSPGDFARNRVFYEDGTPINLTISGRYIDSNITVNFSPIDSYYQEGDEDVSWGGAGTFYAYYWIEQANTRLNARYQIVAIDHTYNDTIAFNLSLKNGVWEYSYVTMAQDCSLGMESDYFEENDICPDLAWDGTKVVGRYVDVGFSFAKFSSPFSVEKLCSNQIDDQDIDGLSDCADNDCASIIYACANNSLGWRDDPLGPPFGHINCNYTTNLCYTNVNSTTVTDVTYTYNMGPGGYFGVRFEQASQVQGHSVYFAIANLNSSLDIVDSSFTVVNYSAATGLNDQDLMTATNAVRGQTGPQGDQTNFTGTNMDFVFFVKIPSNATIRGDQIPRLIRLISPEPSGMVDIKYNISSDGMVYEHDISCMDSVDNDLFYDTDCLDPDCDGWRANPSDPYDVCSYGNESKLALENNTCIDDFDNDADGPKDCTWSNPDSDCNGTYIINASWDIYNIGGETGVCELAKELNCSDGFDNDRDRIYDCVTKEVSNGINYSTYIDYSSNPVNPLCVVSNPYTSNNDSYPDAEYDCAAYCQANSVSSESSVAGCLDGKDNDLDFYNIGTCTQNTTGGGIDCRMMEYDSDCNGTSITDGDGLTGDCELINELNCTDGFDNDRDGTYDCTPTDAGADGIPEYRLNIDMDGDYNCNGLCIGENVTENNSDECQDNIDNDLDYWNIIGFTTDYVAAQNPSGGMDCRYDYDGLHPGDPNCVGVNITDGDGNTGVCQLQVEQNCTDGMDNDLDQDYNAGADHLKGIGGADCDDYDCAGKDGCPVLEYLNATDNQTHYSNETPDDIWCLDGKDNDLDRYIYQNASGSPENSSGGVDCIYNYDGIRPSGILPYINVSEANATYSNYLADTDCNNTPIGNSSTDYALCELEMEQNCSDTYDNDRDYYVSELVTHVGTDVNTANWSENPLGYESYFNATFAAAADCDDYSCTGDSNCPSTEAVDLCNYTICGDDENWCLDGVDNDLDDYLADGYTAGIGGVDCRWENYDLDCNNTLINDTSHDSIVGVCTINWEYNCTDYVDNDQDLGIYTWPGAPAGSASAGLNTSIDCDDYDCQGNLACPMNETNCSDGIDNDLDAYFWNETLGAYQLNSTSGIDCADPNCDGRTGPGGFACAFEEKMEGFNPYTLCGDYDVSAYSFDNDGDIVANCHDDGCYHEGQCRVCPPMENITADACADSLDNELEFETADIAKLLYFPAQVQYSTDGKDCSDSDCASKVGDINSDGVADGICTGTGGLITETSCADSLDNDLDGSTDCEDSNCAAAANCLQPWPTSVGTCTSGWNCTNDNYIYSLTENVPQQKVNLNWGSKTTDLIYTEFQYQGGNLSFRFYNYDQSGGHYLVMDDVVVMYIGTASNPLPNQYNATSANNVFVEGIQAENFSVSYTVDGLAVQFNDGITNSYPDQPLNITVIIQVPDAANVTQGSSYAFGINHNIAGEVSSGALATEYVLETEAPVTTVARPRESDEVRRIRVSDTIAVYANATDFSSGLFNSGIDYCQFYNGSVWVNENSISGTSKGDCKHDLIISDGTHELRARAYDGVDNLGDYDNISVTVITIPRQASDFYCSAAGNCAESYPTRDHYMFNESLSIEINFTSDVYGFSSNETGCTVYAEDEGTVYDLGSVNLTAVGNTAVCSGTVSLLGLPDLSYYRISVKVFDDNGEVAISGENPYDDGYLKKGIWICQYVEMLTGYACVDKCELIAPTTIYLYSPANNSINYTRNTEFYWYGIGTLYTYHIQVDDDPNFYNKEINEYNVSDTGLSLSNYTSPDELDVDTLYYWRVRSYDGVLYGNWSDVWQFTLQSMRSIILRVDTIDFGVVNRSIYYNTSDDDPYPFVVENDGNILTNVSLNATSFFTSVSYPSENYQYGIGINETGSFNSGLSTMSYINMSYAMTGVDIYDLDYHEPNDDAQCDLMVNVPDAEPAGPKVSNVLFSTS